MYGYIDGIDWLNAEPMRYWSFPKSYKKDKIQETKELIYSGEYWGALKIDGYYQRILKDEDGNCFMIARNKNVKGEPINKVEWVPQFEDFYKALPKGTCLLAEVYLPGNEGSKNITSLLGCLKDKCIKRQEENQKLHLYIFDIMAYAGLNHSNVSFLARVKTLKDFSKIYKHDYVDYATYYNGHELYQKIQSYLTEGREGVVITHEACPVYFKRTPARKTIKIKKELQETLDVIVLGAQAPTREYMGKYIEDWDLWEDTFTKEKFKEKLYKDYSDGRGIEPVTKAYWNGWAGSLVIGAKKDGNIIPIGTLSGLTEEVLKNWRNYKGKVCEISAMEVMDNGLRHPVFVGWRDDLTEDDCDWHKIFG